MYLISSRQDFYAGGESRPPKDAQQDYNLTASSENGDKTLLTVERKRSTGDEKDVQLKVRLLIDLSPTADRLITEC